MKLMDYIIKMKMSQSKFAKRAHLSLNCVQSVIHGRAPATYTTARKIELATGGAVSSGDVLEGKASLTEREFYDPI